MSKITAGQVDITLGNDTLTLAPTIEAMTKISRTFGGMKPAIDRVLALDIDAFTVIIATGAGLSGNKAAGLGDKVWKHGMDNLVGGLTDYLLILRNGGRPLSSGDDGEGAEGNVES
jgi:hypothetical protein